MPNLKLKMVPNSFIGSLLNIGEKYGKTVFLVKIVIGMVYLIQHTYSRFRKKNSASKCTSDTRKHVKNAQYI